jgi:tripartite-type tricarboxylate transporter receptor subunit TctC
MIRERNMASISRREALAALAGTVTASLHPNTAAAQAYPNKPIRWVVPYAPGGLPDTVARVVAQRLQDKLGQGVVIENKPGANGSVAASSLATASNDGYTFLVTDGSMLSINPLMYSKLTYDPIKDYTPVSALGRAPLFLALHPSVPAASLQEFIAYVKANPGKINYGSSGIGSTHHLSMEALKASLGLDMTHVPYKGTGQSVPALLGGQVEVLFSAYPSLAAFHKDGKVKLIATNGAKRSSQAPDVPAIAELIPGFDFAPVVGILALAGTPTDVIAKISAEASAVLKMPETIQALATAGIEAVGGSVADYTAIISGETTRVATAIKAAGIKPE